MVKVTLTKHLYQFFPDLEGKELEVTASTVAEAVQALDCISPGLANYICDERGRLRAHVNIFLGAERVADRTRLSDALQDDSHLYIIQALSGG